MGYRKECNWNQQPNEKKKTEAALRLNIAPLPPLTCPLGNRHDRKYCPGKQREQCDRKEIPKGLCMVIEVGSEARKIVLQNEYLEKLRIFNLHGDVPRQNNG